jgi:hypothetical protein
MHYEAHRRLDLQAQRWGREDLAPRAGCPRFCLNSGYRVLKLSQT